jgi:iron complex transport system ATP-binding protein
LQTGEWLSWVDANSFGKSTLLKLISRILSPQQGVILVDGKATHSQPPLRTFGKSLVMYQNLLKQPLNLVAQKLALLPK